ncbi:Paa1p [Sugiyamaella lignohabitans]|uniref:Paa1p n=1 Tax=Sugiyamaella lignohabitans TaxID=796027 RepID=A0A167DSL3_9ASCO|nr:Paa1p [Sugiyamaella lignohabitans]ANB13244.1 Paa1p [Sugiyamaella lignohabitans]
MTYDLPPHAVIRPLGLKDVDAFLTLEERGFPPEERCSKEKCEYRLRICPELSSGVFIREFHSEESNSGARDNIHDGLPPSTSSVSSERLIAHILATKMTTDHVTDEAMELPDLDQYGRAVDPKDSRGHHEEGRTIGIHSVVVDPSFQGKSIGTILIRDYIQRITTQHIADRIALIAHDRLVPFYERLGFVNDSASPVKLAGGGWRHMWVPLSQTDDDEDDLEDDGLSGPV